MLVVAILSSTCAFAINVPAAGAGGAGTGGASSAGTAAGGGSAIVATTTLLLLLFSLLRYCGATASSASVIFPLLER